jgi:hypothetical protein
MSSGAGKPTQVDKERGNVKYWSINTDKSIQVRLLINYASYLRSDKL